MNHDGMKQLLVLALTFFIPVAPVVGIIALLILVDYGLGHWVRNKKGECFQKEKALKGASKVIVWTVVLPVAYMVEFVIIPELPLMRLSAAWIAYHELKSIFGHANVITGYDIWDAIRSAIAKKLG
jgi:hypothetical protein